jgi:hypothetical protein
MTRFVYTPAQIRSWLRALRREVRRNRLWCQIEYGQLDLGGEG